MSDLFDIYQENIKSIFGKVLKTLDNIQIYSNEKAETALVEADSHLKEADRIVRLSIIIHRPEYAILYAHFLLK